MGLVTETAWRHAARSIPIGCCTTVALLEGLPVFSLFVKFLSSSGTLAIRSAAWRSESKLIKRPRNTLFKVIFFSYGHQIFVNNLEAYVACPTHQWGCVIFRETRYWWELKSPCRRSLWTNSTHLLQNNYIKKEEWGRMCPFIVHMWTGNCSHILIWLMIGTNRILL
jgi:hypothetical protein